VLAAACEVAAQGSIITLGIAPDHPSTGFGYIERGDLLEKRSGVEVFRLLRFAEKPDLATAKRFLAAGNYSWNSGMFIWPVRRVLDEFRQHAPALSGTLEEIAASIGRSDYNDRLAHLWPGVQKVSVDFALMEHIRQGVAVIPVQMGWADIGNFAALFDTLAANGDNNITLGHDALLVDTSNTLIHSERLVAAIGLEDVVIVDTDDVLLVCKRDRAQDVKKLVEMLKESQRNEYL
jgi:mannose-1-phosphate guanylyltransferase